MPSETIKITEVEVEEASALASPDATPSMPVSKSAPVIASSDANGGPRGRRVSLAGIKSVLRAPLRQIRKSTSSSPDSNGGRIHSKSKKEYGGTKYLELDGVEVTRLRCIDEADGSFESQLFVRLRIPNGASDSSLTATAPGSGGDLQVPYFPFTSNALEWKQCEARESGNACPLDGQELTDTVAHYRSQKFTFGSEQPPNVAALKDKLAKGQRLFTKEEWSEFNVEHVRDDDFVEADGKYFRPVHVVDLPKPTFKPNAAWYLHQIVIENLDMPPKEQLEKRDQNVRIMGGDVYLTLYSEGKFFQMLQLDEFPFDSQDLTFTVTLNVQTKSPMCLPIFEVPEADRTNDRGSYRIYKPGNYLHEEWEQDKYFGKHDLHVKAMIMSVHGDTSPPGQAGKSSRASKMDEKIEEMMHRNAVFAAKEEGREFSTVHISVKVIRKPRYFYWNVIMPSALLGMFGLLQFSMDAQESTRHELSMGLVLTTFLFKLSALSPSMLPPVNYMTHLDKFVQVQNLLVWLMAIENGIINAMHRVAHHKLDEDLYEIRGNIGSGPVDLDSLAELYPDTYLVYRDRMGVAYWVDNIFMGLFAAGWLLHILQFVIVRCRTRAIRMTTLELLDFYEKSGHAFNTGCCGRHKASRRLQSITDIHGASKDVTRAAVTRRTKLEKSSLRNIFSAAGAPAAAATKPASIVEVESAKA